MCVYECVCVHVCVCVCDWVCINSIEIYFFVVRVAVAVVVVVQLAALAVHKLTLSKWWYHWEQRNISSQLVKRCCVMSRIRPKPKFYTIQRSVLRAAAQFIAISKRMPNVMRLFFAWLWFQVLDVVEGKDKKGHRFVEYLIHFQGECMTILTHSDYENLINTCAYLPPHGHRLEFIVGSQSERALCA